MASLSESASETTASEPPDHEYIAIAATIFLVITIASSYIDARWIQSNDLYNLWALLLPSIHMLSVLYDCLFTVRITYHLEYDASSSSPFFVLLLCSIMFMLTSLLLSFLQLHRHMSSWDKNSTFHEWLSTSRHRLALYLLCTLCAGSFSGVRLCGSNLFMMDIFNIPLNKYQCAVFHKKKLYSTLPLQVFFSK